MAHPVVPEEGFPQLPQRLDLQQQRQWHMCRFCTSLDRCQLRKERWKKKVLHATSLKYQRKQAGACYDFLTGPDSSLLQLNYGHQVYTRLVGVPKSNLFKLVYCAGVGSSPIGATHKLVDGQLFLLQGDRNADTGPP